MEELNIFPTSLGDDHRNATSSPRPNEAQYTADPHKPIKSATKPSSPPPYATSVAHTTSSGSSISWVDQDWNTLMAESWSAPTYANSESYAGDDCFRIVVERPPTEPVATSPADNLRNEATARSVSTYDDLPAEHSNATDAGCIFDKDSRLSPVVKSELDLLVASDASDWTDGHAGPPANTTSLDAKPITGFNTRAFTQNYMGKRFLAEDTSEAPWQVYHLRSAGSICAFCASSFTGPDHRQKVIDHTREKHLPSQNGISAVSNSKPRCDHLKASHIATYKPSESASATGKHYSEASKWPKNRPIPLASDLNGIGTHWQRKTRSATPHVYMKTAGPPDQIALQIGGVKNLRSLVCLAQPSSSLASVEKLNDYLNGLDIIADNLLHRYPNGRAAQGLRNALLRLEPTSDFRFDRDPTPSGAQITALSGTNNNTSSTSPGSGYASGSAISSSHGNHSGNGYAQDSKSNGQAFSFDSEDLNLKVDTQSRSQKRARPRFACPISKHEEFRNQPRTCAYKGGKSMSDITTHLKSDDHRQRYPYIELCHNCWEHIINSETWQNVHVTKLCTVRVQPRGEERIVAQWKALYNKMHPDSTRTPSPFVGVRSSTLNQIASRNTQVVTSRAPNPNTEFNANDMPNDPYQTVPHRAFMEHSPFNSAGATHLTPTLGNPAVMTPHFTPARDQSFLEESLGVAHRVALRTNSTTPHPTTQANEPRAIPISRDVKPMPGTSHQAEPYNYSFDASTTLPNPPHAMQGFDASHQPSFHEVDMPFAIDEWAADRIIAEQIQDFTQPPSDSSNHSFAALIALAPSMNQEERDALSNRMLAKVNDMVHIIQSQPTGQRNRLASVPEHVQSTPTRSEREAENALLQDFIASPYAVHVWDDAELLDLDSGPPDTASRSFYPDLFPLATVPYV